MPIRTQSDLPAKEILEQENIFVMDESRAMHQDIRPINIVILNLMPLKEETELQIFRSLSNTPLQVDVSLLAPASHASTHTSKSHLNKFYQTFQEIKNQYFDGLIITGAPVEQMKYEEVDYWDEVCEIMEWSKKHVTSTLHLCWGAQAALYYHYGIQKYDLKQKMFGVFRHHVMNLKIPMVRGFDDYFYAPHSRHTEIREEDILKHEELTILAKSKEAGVFLVINQDGSQIFDLGLTFTYSLGGYSFDKTGTLIETDGSQEKSYNLPVYALDRWQKPGDITDVPRFVLEQSAGPQNSSRYIHSTDHIRLKNLTIGFTLPGQWTRKALIENARVYFSGSNLLTWAKWKQYDPEVPVNGEVFCEAPAMRTFNFGGEITF